jgi:hypothetical protein
MSYECRPSFVRKTTARNEQMVASLAFSESLVLWALIDDRHVQLVARCRAASVPLHDAGVQSVFVAPSWSATLPSRPGAAGWCRRSHAGHRILPCWKNSLRRASASRSCSATARRLAALADAVVNAVAALAERELMAAHGRLPREGSGFSDEEGRVSSRADVVPGRVVTSLVRHHGRRLGACPQPPDKAQPCTARQALAK